MIIILGITVAVLFLIAVFGSADKSEELYDKKEDENEEN